MSEELAAPWRPIIRRDTNWSERASLSGRRFSWSATYEHRLTLECGHVQTRSGHSPPPKHKVKCKSCLRRLAPTVDMATVEHGVFDHTRKRPPKGAALVEALMGGTK